MKIRSFLLALAILGYLELPYFADTTVLRSIPPSSARGSAPQGNPADPEPDPSNSVDMDSGSGDDSAGTSPNHVSGHSKIWDNNLFPTDADSGGSLIGSAMSIYLDLVLWHLGVQRAFLVGYGGSISEDSPRAERVNIGIARDRSGQRSWAQGRARIDSGRR